jgi:hypothetical protein
MMAIFATRQPNNGSESQQQPERPKIHSMIEHLDQAQMHMNAAMQVCSSVIIDLEKGAAFIGRYRDSLVKAVADAGGDSAASIEHQIREFIPKTYRPPEPDAQSREG